MKTLLATLVLTVVFLSSAPAQSANYDETKIPPYKLPDALTCADGTRVTKSNIWTTKRRPELVRLFENEIFGRAPGRPEHMYFITRSLKTNALGGKATRKEITIWFNDRTNGPNIDLLVYVPNGATRPSPAFLGLNFNGNHAVTTEPDVALSERWFSGRKGDCVTNNHATDACRGLEASRWPIEKIISRGYALATVYYGDLEPDFAEGWQRGGIRSTLNGQGTNTTFKPDDWGAISAWAWGLSRALDCLQMQSKMLHLDDKRVSVIGHSRLGKTALWSGAIDQRFAIAFSNDSGEGGAAIARRRIGERTGNLNKSFPHWFCGNFKKYSDHEDDLPIDAHELIALMAPRPVYIASATEDKWADPHGEFLAGKAAEPVYALFQKKGLVVDESPAADKSVGDTIGYHIRTGKHDITEYDWEQYLNFADRHFHR